MTRGAIVSALTVAALCMVASCGHVPSATKQDKKPLSIEMKADGRHCVIVKMEIECSEVVTYLRQVLKLAPGSQIGFKLSKGTPYETVEAVLSALQKSEYALKLGYVNISDAP